MSRAFGSRDASSRAASESRTRPGDMRVAVPQAGGEVEHQGAGAIEERLQLRWRSRRCRGALRGKNWRGSGPASSVAPASAFAST